MAQIILSLLRCLLAFLIDVFVLVPFEPNRSNSCEEAQEFTFVGDEHGSAYSGDTARELRAKEDQDMFSYYCLSSIEGLQIVHLIAG